MKNWITVWVLATLFLAASAKAQSLFPDWQWRAELTVSGYTQPGNLTNFPVLVKLGPHISNFDYNDFDSPATGADLRFADSNETVELIYEIELWNTNGTSVIWVQAPEISSAGDTVIYAYWGNSAAAQPAYTTNGATWSEGYAGVWHMADATTTTIADSTTSGYGGTKFAVSKPSETDGIVSRAQQFNGSDAYVNNVGGVSDFSFIQNTLVFTISGFAKLNSTSSLAALLGNTPAASAEKGFMLAFSGSTQAMRFDVTRGVSGSPLLSFVSPNNTVSDTGWHHWSAVGTGSGAVLYLDGVQVGSASTVTAKPTGDSTRTLNFGRANYSSTILPFSGLLDEIRISTVARGSNWMWACWSNQVADSTFVAYGAAGVQSTALRVQALPATGIGDFSVTLNGKVQQIGEAENPYVYFCWDFTDAGTNSGTSVWANVESMGTNWGEGESFSTNLTGLLSGSNYAYRCYATNSTGQAWSENASSFMTLALPAVDNDGLEWVRRREARVHGTLSDDGGQDSLVWAEYWPNGGAMTSVVTVGTVSAAAFDMVIGGLDDGVLYNFRFGASNSAGAVWSAADSFTTLNADPIGWYVSTNGNSSAGTEWGTAFHDIAAALLSAESGDTIYLAGDTFVLDAQLDLNLTNLTLSGGYAATNEAGIPGEYDTRRWRTVLTRDPEAGRVRMIEVSADNVTIERLELRDGSADGPGGGIHAANVNGLAIRHCRFIDNTCYETWGTEGGGLSLVNVQGSVSHSFFRGNSSTRWHSTYQATAGGVAIRNGSMALFDIVLVGDHGATQPHTGSGIWMSGGQHGLTNILAVFLGRQNADQGSGIHIVAGTQVEIANATVYGNYGDGIRNLAGANTVIRDSIIYGNTHPLSGGRRDIINGTDGNGAPPLLYNNIIGDGGGAGLNDNWNVDPRFDYPLFYLVSDSPALDSGSRTVADAGLSGWTSLTNGVADSGTVNRGYHFADGLGIDLELYVSPDGNDGNAGSGPASADALRTITRALEIAGENAWLDPRVRIHVASGDYTTASGETFPLEADGITVQLAGTDAETTIIDAGGSATGNQRVFALTDSLGDNRIEGVTITGGYISGTTARGIGVYADKSLLTVASSILRDNLHVGTQYGIGYGAGLYAVESGVMIRDSEISDNRVSGSNAPRGGGVSVERGRTILENTILSGNESRNTHTTWGGSRGGGLNVFGMVVLRNVLMTGNQATRRARYGNAIFVEGGDLAIENATIVTNINDIASGVAIHRNNGSGTLRNTILWDNVGDFNSTNNFNIAYCLSAELDDGVNNNLTADPLFVDAGAGDFRLTALSAGVTPSPAVDAGSNRWWMAGAVDLAGQPRILRSIPSNPSPTVDLGAYETAPPSGSMFMFR